MFGRNLRRQHAGRKIGHRTIDRTTEAVGATARLRAGTGLAQFALAGIPLLRRAEALPDAFWGRCTANLGAGLYSFQRLDFAISGTWTDVVDGFNATGTATEVNGTATLTVPFVALMRYDPHAGADGHVFFQMSQC